jgi:hypothetical protein
MSIAFRCTATVLSLALGSLAMNASAQQVSGTTVNRGVAKAASVSVTPKQRGELARQFVSKWGGYVQRVYKVPVGVWSKRMVPNFATVDSANFRDALKRDTFEGAMAALSGSGHRLSDERVISKFASMKSSSDQRVLGSLSNDLVFTPIQPCRILDTRNTVAGPIAGNSSRNFVSINQANFTAQGGSATDCGTLGLNATAVAINLTAVLPTGAGFATVYPFGTTLPLAASVNYTAGAIVNNGIIAQIPNPLTTSDFTIYTFAQSHYVADIVGYFAPPQATPLGCTSTFVTQNVVANDIFDIQIPSCPTGYTVTGAGCRTPGFNEASWAINGLFRSGSTISTYCSGQNLTAGNITVEGTAQCCRVPGR